MSFYIAQGISILTALTAIITMQLKKMEWILIGQILANLLTATTYFLLGGFSGAGICILAILQTAVMFFFKRRGIIPPLALHLGFIAFYIVCSAYYFKSMIDFASGVAAICFSISVMQEKPAASRAWYVFNPLLWIVYDIFTQAYANLIMHLIVFLSTFIAMIRIDNIFKNRA